MKYPKMNVEDMVETCYVKEGDEYVLGRYQDRVSLNGFYLKAKSGSLLERIQNMAVTKFQLENDAENFKQEALLGLWLSIEKYYSRFGYDENVKIDGFIYTDCKYRFMDMAKLAKSNVSVCDRKTGKYHINKIESYEKKFVEEIDKIRNQKDERFISELYNEDYEDENTNEFKKWLDENMDTILTKKQADYLKGEFIIHDVSSVWRIHKNIVQRVEKAYAQSKAKEERLKKLDKHLTDVQEVLDFTDEEDFIRKIVKLSFNSKSTLLVNVYENLSMEHCKILTEIINSKGEIKGNKDFYYDILAVLTYKELEIKNRIEELKGE